MPKWLASEPVPDLWDYAGLTFAIDAANRAEEYYWRERVKRLEERVGS